MIRGLQMLSNHRTDDTRSSNESRGFNFLTVFPTPQRLRILIRNLIQGSILSLLCCFINPQELLNNLTIFIMKDFNRNFRNALLNPFLNHLTAICIVIRIAAPVNVLFRTDLRHSQGNLQPGHGISRHKLTQCNHVIDNKTRPTRIGALMCEMWLTQYVMPPTLAHNTLVGALGKIHKRYDVTLPTLAHNTLVGAVGQTLKR